MDILTLYVRLIAASIRSQMQYKVSFLADFLVAFFGLFLEFAAVLIIFTRFDSIGGWALPEVALLYGMSSISFALAELVAAGFDEFPNVIRRGEFDRVLIRPRGAFFQVMTSQFTLRRLGRLAQGTAVLGLAIHWLSISWSLGKVLLLLAALGGGMAFFSGLFVIGATISFWTVESLEVMNALTYGGTEMLSYPMHIYHEWMRRIFVFAIPAAFVNYFPALYLLGLPDPFAMPPVMPFLAPLIASSMAVVGAVLWRFGVRHYTSTGT